MSPERKPRRLERELGVPIAGEILDPSQWTQTALKRLPAEGALDLEALFGRRAPLVVDLGCGNGRYLLSSAVWRRDHDHLGIDILPVVIRYATRRGNQRGLTNLRFAVCDGERLLRQYLPPGSTSEIHCYHPQPYYDPTQVHRRLLTPTFLAMVHATLVPGGLFYLQSDHPGYWRYLRQVVPFFFSFEERQTPWPDAPRGRTRREIIAQRKGLPIFRGVGRARLDLDLTTARAQAEHLPPPLFDASRQLREVDHLEQNEK